MTDLKLPEVEESPNGRRAHYRMVPTKMVAVIDCERYPGDLTDPESVVDFSMGGVGILTLKDLQYGEKVNVTLFYDRLKTTRIPATVRSVRKVADLSRVGLELDTACSCYKFQKRILETMEFYCIERGEF